MEQPNRAESYRHSTLSQENEELRRRNVELEGQLSLSTYELYHAKDRYADLVEEWGQEHQLANKYRKLERFVAGALNYGKLVSVSAIALTLLVVRTDISLPSFEAGEDQMCSMGAGGGFGGEPDSCGLPEDEDEIAVCMDPTTDREPKIPYPGFYGPPGAMGAYLPLAASLIWPSCQRWLLETLTLGKPIPA